MSKTNSKGVPRGFGVLGVLGYYRDSDCSKGFIWGCFGEVIFLEILIRKLSSRKLWAAVAGVVTGLSIVFGLDQSVVNSVAGAVVSLVSVVMYIYTEGKIDSEAVKKAVDDINTVKDTLDIQI